MKVRNHEAAQNPANSFEKSSVDRTRVPMSTAQQKLSVPEIPGFHLHWMMGSPSRIAQAMKAGYTFVDPDEVDDFLDPGSPAAGEALLGMDPAGYMGGFVAVAREHAGVELVGIESPLFPKTGTGSGWVTQEAFERFTGVMLDQLRAGGPWDGVYLCLHGAMAVRGVPRPEAALARAKLPFEAKAGGFIPLDELQELHRMAFANLYVTSARTFHHKAIERQITIERLDEPIAVAKAARVLTGLESMSLIFTVAGQVEPMTGPTFAERGMSQQSIEPTFQRIGRVVRFVFGNLRGFRRKTKQVEIESS